MINLGSRTSYLNPSSYRVLSNMDRLIKSKGLTYARYLERLGEEMGMNRNIPIIFDSKNMQNDNILINLKKEEYEMR